MAEGKIDLLALIGKKPGNKPMADEEDESDESMEDSGDDGPTLLEAMHKAMKAGDYSGAYDALEKAVMLCTSEGEE